nr:immunoglobulin light chain junction region [Macaca mulatta]
YCQGKQLPLTF